MSETGRRTRPFGMSNSVLRVMNRKLRLCGLGLALALGMGGAPLAEAASPPPNIVLLVADDWGYSDPGAFGGEIATPHIDELARRGVRFSNFHVAASCSPTRAMLLTGVEHHLAGVGNLRESMPLSHLGQPGYGGSLNRRVLSVATLLQSRGYRTYVTGKWNVGTEAHNLPDQRGFDRSLVLGDTGADNWDPAQRYLPLTSQVNWFEDGRPAHMPARFYSSTYFVDKMLGYIDAGAASGKPFFAYLGFQANHVPLQAPQALIDRYRGRYDDGWTALRQARRDRAAEQGLIPRGAPMLTMATTPDWAALSPEERQYQARVMEVYAAMAEAMDAEVGRLVDHLKAAGAYENTVFVFLSDNGPEAYDYAGANVWINRHYTRELARLGGPGAYAVPGPGWASASASPLATYKFYAGEGGLRTPLIISGVPGMAEGAVSSAWTHVTDIVPTLLGLAGAAGPPRMAQGQPIEPLTGRSLLPTLGNSKMQAHTSDEAMGYELSGNRALFKGDLKLVLNLPPVGDGLWHLYNLREDPGETRDLQGSLPLAFSALQAEHAAWSARHGVLPMPAGYSPARQVALNWLVLQALPAALPWLAGLGGLVAAGGLGLALRRRRRGHRRDRQDSFPHLPNETKPPRI